MPNLHKVRNSPSVMCGRRGCIPGLFSTSRALGPWHLLLDAVAALVFFGHAFFFGHTLLLLSHFILEYFVSLSSVPGVCFERLSPDGGAKLGLKLKLKLKLGISDIVERFVTFTCLCSTSLQPAFSLCSTFHLAHPAAPAHAPHTRTMSQKATQLEAYLFFSATTYNRKSFRDTRLSGRKVYTANY